LADEDKITRGPTNTEWVSLRKAAQEWAKEYDDGAETEVDDFIYDHAPEMLETEWRKVIEGNRGDYKQMWVGIEDDRDRERRMGNYAPKINDAVERDENPDKKGDVTEKQKVYLRNLGVRDQEHVLERIDRDAASKMIERVLAVRRQNGLFTPGL